MTRWHEKLGIGTAAFGMAYGLFKGRESEVDLAEIRRILAYAARNDMRIIDTAYHYHQAYPRLVKCLHPQGRRKVVYKIPANHEIEPKDLLRLNKSFRYCLMHHHGDVMVKNFDEELESLLRQQSKYKFKKLGVSVYCPNVLNKILDKHHFDVVQVPHNLNLHEFDLKALKDRGCEVHVRSVFSRGELIRAGVSMEECIDFVLESIDHIDSILIGMHNEKQLIDICHYIKTRERLFYQNNPSSKPNDQLRHA